MFLLISMCISCSIYIYNSWSWKWLEKKDRNYIQDIKRFDPTSSENQINNFLKWNQPNYNCVRGFSTGWKERPWNFSVTRNQIWGMLFYNNWRESVFSLLIYGVEASLSHYSLYLCKSVFFLSRLGADWCF